MKRYGYLFEHIVAFENLLLATKKAARGKRKKHRVAHFLFHLEKELFGLQEELQTESYQPRPYHLFDIEDPKPRRICAADFRDRVVHHAICNAIEPMLERRLIYDTWACRRGKGTHAAVKRAQFFARRYPYYLKCDIRHFFDSIDHRLLKQLLARIFKDKKLVALLYQIIDFPMPYGSPDKGVPIGNLTSQHFANQYLGELDHYLKDKLGCKAYLRYMDDFILFADDKVTLQMYLQQLELFLQEYLQLTLKSSVTVIAPVSEGLPFLGFRIFPQLIRVQGKTLGRFRQRLKQRQHEWQQDLIDEQAFMVSLSGIMAHISHADTWGLRQHLLQSLTLSDG